jgi:endonuclease/exonuclease/phosphatase family metal-dependent hydrolase
LCEPELGFRGTPVRIGVTHLSLERPLRAPQIQRIAEIIAGGDVPTILAGDFNVAKNDELRLLTEGDCSERIPGRPFHPGPHKDARSSLF